MGGLVVWVVVALGLALLLGAMVRLADQRSDAPVRTTASVAGATALAGARAAGLRARRRRVPLPPIGVGLVALGTGLMVTGYVVGMTAGGSRYAEVLSMDAPLSVPRLFVAALFALAAVAAVAGAGRHPGRRAWWTAVALVTGTIAALKAGGTVHTRVLGALEDRVGAAGAVLASVLVLAGVLGGLWLVSRGDRRDRTRVLGALALYGAASVGLSAVSSVVDGRWAVAATLVEETGEAWGAAVCLVAVLVGVAPRLVLPRSWVLQREADAASLELPDALPGRPALSDPATG